MEYYQSKKNTYFTNSRKDIIQLLKKNPESKILEIGAGGGDTLIEIKLRGLASEVWGVELFSLPNSNQKDESIDRFFISNIEKEFDFLPKNYFDAILCGDVLEHLVDPWTVVSQLTECLKIGGVFISSIPNIRIRSAFSKIYWKGDFSYTDAGTFDKTHLRFFCKKNMIELFSSERLQVVKTFPNFDFNDNEKRFQILNRLTFRLFEEFLALQFLIISEKIK